MDLNGTLEEIIDNEDFENDYPEDSMFGNDFALRSFRPKKMITSKPKGMPYKQLLRLKVSL